jgi:hypothetical protein
VSSRVGSRRRDGPSVRERQLSSMDPLRGAESGGSAAPPCAELAPRGLPDRRFTDDTGLHWQLGQDLAGKA